MDFAPWATVLGVSVEDIQTAWQDMERRGLVTLEEGRITVSPLAMRRATTPLPRCLAAHLSGYLLTDNTYIVRREGDPPGNRTQGRPRRGKTRGMSERATR